MANIQLFEGVQQAILYSKFRFTYPEELIATIKQCITTPTKADTCIIDLGCGSGQSILSWTDTFNKCIGTDISEAQISCARNNIAKSNVEFIVCSSDKLPLADKSVDMVTCAQAWHWLDHSSTIPEIKRVLKSPGYVAIYGYGNIILRNSLAEKLVREFYSETLNGYWHHNRIHVDQMYSQLPMVYPTDGRKVFPVNKTMNLVNFMGYINTWSGYIEYKMKNQDSIAFDVLEKQLHDVIKGDTIEIIIPYFLYLSHQQ